MADIYGWTGTLLRVNLTTGEITTEDSTKYQKYIGGMGIGYRVIYDEVPMGTHPYDEASKFVMAVGPLTGSGVPCSGRMNISFLSSWSKGHSIIDAHMGGHIGPQLKYAGYDAVIVEGKSASPVYLKIADSKVSLEDASEYWGLGTFASNKKMTEECGREFECASIGAAGEHLVNYSTLNTSFGNSGGAGIGAIMGSKNLKGVAIRGTGSCKVADPKKLLELNDYMLKELIGANNNHNVPAVPQSWAEYSAVNGKNRWSGAPGRKWEKAEGGPIDTEEQPCGDINRIAYRCLKGVFDYGEVASKYIVKQGGCQSCPIRCYTEYEMDPLADYDLPVNTSNTCMPVLYGNTFYPEIFDFVDEGDAKVIINGAASHAQDDLGLWCNYGNLYRDFHWFFTSGKIKEILPEEEYNSIPWEWQAAGDPRFCVEIMRRIAYNEGELATIGAGTLAMVEKWNLGQEFLDRVEGDNQNVTYNGYPKHHGAEDSAQIGQLFNLMYNRDCMIHHLTNVCQSGAPFEEVTKPVMESFFGEGCLDPQKNYTPINENKIKVAKWAFNGKQLHDAATVCNWMWPMTQSPSKEREYKGDLDLEAKFMSAVTGIEYTRESLEFDAERISQMLRVMTAISFNTEFGVTELRESHDAIPAWIFDKEPDFQPFEEGTIKMDRDDMEKAKDMFYEAMGWDVATGLPTRATLEKFELGDMADALEKIGMLPA